MREKIQSHFSCQKSKRREVQLWFYWSFEVLLVTWVANSMVWHEELLSKTCTTVAYLLLCAGCRGLAMFAKFTQDYQFNQSMVDWSWNGLLMLRGEGNELHSSPTCSHISCHSSWMLLYWCCAAGFLRHPNITDDFKR